MKIRFLLERHSDVERGLLVPGARHDMDAERQAFIVESTGHRNPGKPRKISDSSQRRGRTAFGSRPASAAATSATLAAGRRLDQPCAG